MAESISLAAGIIELTNTGFSLGKFLNETWLAYKNAPAEVLEIAHEVTICCELMTPLGEQLKSGSVHYTSKFQEAVEGLVKNSTTTFYNVRALVPDDGRIRPKDVLPKWDYVLKRSKIAAHRKKLKEIQQMFLFMKQMMLEANPVKYHHPAINITQAGAPFQPTPITLTGHGVDGDGLPVTYHAILEMQPAGLGGLRARGSSSPASHPRPVAHQQGVGKPGVAKPRPPASVSYSSPSRIPEPMKKAKKQAKERKADDYHHQNNAFDPLGLGDPFGSVLPPPLAPLQQINPLGDNWPQQSPTYLSSLRQNPFFSRDLLGSAESRSGIQAGSRDRREGVRKDDGRRRSSLRLSPSLNKIEAQDTAENLQIPDNNEATQDVKDLMTSWFGPEQPQRTCMQRSYQPVNPFAPRQYQYGNASPTTSAFVPSPSSEFRSSEISPPLPPAPLPPGYIYHEGVAIHESVLQNQATNPSQNSYSKSASVKVSVSYQCDGCAKIIGETRHMCLDCADYNLCPTCFNDPHATIRLKHEHPKYRFSLIHMPDQREWYHY